jgi:hypothetical protein
MKTESNDRAQDAQDGSRAASGSAKWLRLGHQACMIGAAICAARTNSLWQCAFWAGVSLFSAWSADKVSQNEKLTDAAVARRIRASVLLAHTTPVNRQPQSSLQR